ncbi:MAG: ABC transporter permease, partial [Gemmatimonadetes bacterium]|nr:ABC transporter permease [Gemmatimonadota bacterium]
MSAETTRGGRTVVERVFRLLLRLYPRPYRELYAASMEETFALRASEARRNRGFVARGWVVVREMCGLMATAVRQRMVAARGRPTGSPRQPTRRGPRDLFGSLAQEIRHAVRRLMRAPGFTATTVLTLGLGIGANSAIFSVVHGVVLRPLPYPDPDELVWLHHAAPGIGVNADLEVTTGLYLAYGEGARSLAAIALFRTNEFTLTDSGDPERIAVTRATFTLEDVLRVPPMLGRWIREDDTFADGTGVVVLSHALWQRRYGGDPAILGHSNQINGFPFVVIGVMPRGFAFPDTETLAWIPRVVPATASFGGFSDQSVARLRADVTPAEARTDLNAVIPTLADRFPGSSAQSVIDDAKLAALVRPLKQHIVGKVEQTLWILLGTVGFVLLIACANVANLLLVRAEGRDREVAVRTALGAPRSRIVRFFLAESAVLTFAGALLGLGLTWVSVRALIAFGPANIPRLDEIGVNATVLGFTGVISVLAAFVFGAIPLFRPAPSIVSTLKEGGRAATAGHTRFHARNVLIVTQIALALVLLVGSGLMVRSFWHLQQIDPGFRAENVLTFDIGLPSGKY